MKLHGWDLDHCSILGLFGMMQVFFGSVGLCFGIGKLGMALKELQGFWLLGMALCCFFLFRVSHVLASFGV